MSNYIPNKMIKVLPRDPPWINQDLKRMLKRQQRLYKNYKSHGHKNDDKSRVDLFREKCKLAVQNAKISYLEKIGNDIADPLTHKRAYWKW